MDDGVLAVGLVLLGAGAVMIVVLLDDAPYSPDERTDARRHYPEEL
ncbi:MAG: hypothetical protein V9F00_14350 [Nocardioides sp.]